MTEMQWKAMLMQIAGFTFFVSLILATCVACEIVNRKLGWDDDNFVEEFEEDFIYDKTGVRIDLTPTSPEKR